MEFIVVSITRKLVGTIMEYTVVPVGRQVGYLIHYKRNLQNLRSQLENLAGARDRMQHIVDQAKTNGERIYNEVQNWLAKVYEIFQEASLLEDEIQAKTKCLLGICPNLSSYYQLSRRSTKLVQMIKELREKREFPSVSYNAPIEEIVYNAPIEEIVYNAPIEEIFVTPFESRILMVKNIMDELRNPDTNMIGVYGIWGVGKTTLAKEVFRQAIEDNLFDDVVLVLDVKHYPDLQGIQREIAEQLDMDIQETQSIAIRENCLWDRIKDKKILVILDDVSGRIDLEAVGLRPAVTCNILLTSRDREVLSSKMRTQKEFPLEVLGEVETWTLFEKMAGNVVKDDRIRKVAIQVAKRCGNLPLLVVAVASALKNSALEEWKDTLRRFKRFDKIGLTETAFLALEWSYNQLENEELKPLFLLCGTIAGITSGVLLSDLLKYTMGLGLVRNVDTIEEGRNALHSLVRKLKDTCLLLDGFNADFVRMHELVQDVAIRIASSDQQHVLSRAYGDVLKEWPNKDFFKNCVVISLRCCVIPMLPKAPWECPKLKMLNLEISNDDSLDIPSNFFEEMKELKVLDLTGLDIPSLPASFQFLKNLQTLCLDQCVLGDISLVGKLRSLEILSFLSSKVKQLPKEIGQLTGLRMLDLTDCSELVQISPSVISSLNRLEDLRMGRNSFKQWEGEGVISGRSNASLLELRNLSQLAALEIHIVDPSLLPANLFSKELEKYTILIGDCWAYPSETSSNILKLKLRTSNQFDQGIKLLLKRCEHLSLDGMEAVNIISYLLDSDGVKQLNHLHVQNNDKVRYVINSSRWSYSHNAFPNLESLSLYNLISLESVCYGQLIAEPFQKLRSLTLWNLPKLIGFSSEGGRSVVTTRTDKKLMTDSKFDEISLENEIGGPTKLFMNREVLMPNLTSFILHQCDGLRFLFPCSLARSLVQLKHLEISNCQNMQEIVEKDEYSEESTHNMFCKLKHLQLQYLPSFTRFCSGSYIEFSSLELLHIEDCPKLRAFVFDDKNGSITVNKENEERDSKENLENVVQYFLFDEKVGFPSLERVIIYELPKLMTIWHNQLAPDSFCKLREVNIYRCHTLINIFAPCMMGRLNALHTLTIWQCQSLHVVFQVGGVLNVEETYGTSTIQLKNFGCPNLNFVEIDSCENLKTIFPASVAKGLQQLTKLSVENCGLLEIVAREEGSETAPKFVFPKVRVLKFKNLPRLRIFYPGMHISEWPLLKELRMDGCGNVETFASELLRFQGKLELGLLPTPIKQPFFLVEKVLMPNLTSLVVHGCDGLRFLFSSSLAESLVELKNLEIVRCQIMEEIIPANEPSEENTNHNMFCQLKDLKLQYLPNLARFCSAHYINFLSLEMLHLEDCTKLETFIFDPISANFTISREIEKTGSKRNPETDVKYFLFDEKVGFPNLERLFIYDLPKLMTTWHNKLAPGSFSKLKKVSVYRCRTLINIFAPSMIGRLNALDTLEIWQCQSLQVVFAQRGVLDVKETYATSTTKLKSFECPNLDSIVIRSCGSLKNIFPASVAKALQQLKELKVGICGVEEIVAKEELERTPEFVFPKVISLIFEKLPQLRSFYPGLHVSKWPLLNELAFFECGNVEILAAKFSRFQEKHELGMCTPIKQPFFLTEKGNSFPNLEDLSLDENTEIWYEAYGPPPAKLFRKLKYFAFSGKHPKSVVFLEKLSNLKELAVYHGPWKEIFVYDGNSSDEIHAVGTTLPHVKLLCLRKMDELMHLGNANSQPDRPVFANLQILKVYECGRLKNLTSSAISFRNLTTLDVWRCDGLKYLTTCSVAKSLQLLKNLEIEYCERMIEIVASNGDDSETEIAFSHLQHLKLSHLPSLQGFCSGNCIIKVPFLDTLIIKDCLIKLRISTDGLLLSDSRTERLKV